MRVALQSRDEVARPGECLALAIARVRLRPPPGRLDGAAAIGRDDQVAARFVKPLPELPPGRRAAVAEVEVDRGRDGEDLRGAPAHRDSVWRSGQRTPAALTES